MKIKTGDVITVSNYSATVKQILEADSQTIIWESTDHESGAISFHWADKYPNYKGGMVYTSYIGKRAISIEEDTTYLDR